MDERLRRTGFALLTAALLLLPASPALAAPYTGSAPTPALASRHALSELLAWLGSWLGPAPVQSHAAPGGQSVDPNGQPTASDPPGDPVLTPQGGGTVDPNG